MEASTSEKRYSSVSFRRFLTATVVLLCAGSASATEIYSIFYDNRFGLIDDTTGAYTQISTLPDSQSYGIANYDGALYVQDSSSDLIRVDPVSGAATIAGTIGLSNVVTAVFGGGSNGLYEIDEASNLYSINGNTGAGTLIGPTGLPVNNRGWDTSLSDNGTTLYFTEGGAGAIDELYSINTVTGKATDLGSTGVSGIAGSAIVNGNLELFQYHWSGAPDYIYTAPVGSTDFVQAVQLGTQVVDGGVVLSGLGAQGQVEATPEPAPFIETLIGAALIVGLWRMRRKRKIVSAPLA